MEVARGVARSCVICEAPLGVLAAAGMRTCGRATCAWQDRITPPEHRCGVCARLLDVGARAAGVCASPECRRVWVVERRRDTLRRAAEARAARTRLVREAFEAEARRVRADRARALGVADAEAYPVVPIPAHAAPTSRLPAVRRRRLRAHLEDVLAEAMRLRAAGHAGIAPPEPPPPPALAAAYARACANCRGHCCRHGAEHAYVREDTMLRYLAAHPEAGLEEVLDEYLRHVGTRTVRGSCVYHGAHGCTLPRALRADICNRYVCDGLRELRERHDAGVPPRAFLAWSRGGRTGGTFVDVVAAPDTGGAGGAGGAAVHFVDARELRVRRHAAAAPIQPPAG